MTNNLNLDQLTTSQSNKEATINNQAGQLDAALTELLVIDMTNNVTILALDYERHLRFSLTPSGTGKALTLLAQKKFSIISNDSAHSVNIVLGTTTIALPAGVNGFFYTDGTANGLFQQGALSSGAAPNVGDGTTTVTAPPNIVFTSGATVTNVSGDAHVAISGGGGGGGGGSAPSPALKDRFSPTLASHFPTLLGTNSTLPTLTNASDGSLIFNVMSGQTGGDNVRLALKPAPTATPPYDIVGRILVSLPEFNYNNPGLALYDSGSGKFVTFCAQARATTQVAAVDYYNSQTSINSEPYLNNIMPGHEWFRINVGTSNFTFYISRDGDTWIELLTVSKTAFLSTFDKVGFCIGVENSGPPVVSGTNPVSMSIQYYSDPDIAAVPVNGVGVLTTCALTSTTSLINTTWTIVSWPTPLEDPSGAWSSGNPTRFYIPSGKTRFRAHFRAVMNNAPIGFTGLIVTKNDAANTNPTNSNVLCSQYTDTDFGGNTALHTDWLTLTAGDYIEFGVYVKVNSTLEYDNTSFQGAPTRVQIEWA
jgi:hypothetical protein